MGRHDRERQIRFLFFFLSFISSIIFIFENWLLSFLGRIYRQHLDCSLALSLPLDKAEKINVINDHIKVIRIDLVKWKNVSSFFISVFIFVPSFVLRDPHLHTFYSESLATMENPFN